MKKFWGAVLVITLYINSIFSMQQNSSNESLCLDARCRLDELMLLLDKLSKQESTKELLLQKRDEFYRVICEREMRIRQLQRELVLKR